MEYYYIIVGGMIKHAHVHNKSIHTSWCTGEWWGEKGVSLVFGDLHEIIKI